MKLRDIQILAVQVSLRLPSCKLCAGSQVACSLPWCHCTCLGAAWVWKRPGIQGYMLRGRVHVEVRHPFGEIELHHVCAQWLGELTTRKRRETTCMLWSQRSFPYSFRWQDLVMATMKDWETRNARALQEREAQLQLEQEEAELLTYTREDAYSMVN